MKKSTMAAIAFAVLCLAGPSISTCFAKSRPKSQCKCPQIYCPPAPSESVPVPIDDSSQIDSSQQSMVPPPAAQPQPQQSGLLSPDEAFNLASGSDNYLTSSISPAGAGLGTATAMNGMNTVPVSNALISPGFLTSMNIESPHIQDRIGFNYSYIEGMKYNFNNVTFGGLDPLVATSQRDFDINRYDLYLEKALLGNQVSAYVRLPFIDATPSSLQTYSDSNNASFSTPIDSVGNLNVGLKLNIYRDRSGDNVLTTGLTVAAPTSGDQRFVVNARDDNANPGNTVLTTASVNSTYIQPWVAGQLSSGDFFVQPFLGVLVPTDTRIVTSLNANLAVGYTLYKQHCERCGRHGCNSGWIRSVTPILNTQILAPLNDGEVLDYSDQVLLGPALDIGIGKRTNLTVGVSAPVAGPKAYDVAANVGLSYGF